MSSRQQSSAIDIILLQRNTAELRRRLQRLEISEDRLVQEKRISCLVFSGPALESLPRRENVAHSIRTVTHQYLRHDMVQSPINALIMLRDGKIPIEFSLAAHGSDRCCREF